MKLGEGTKVGDLIQFYHFTNAYPFCDGPGAYLILEHSVINGFGEFKLLRPDDKTMIVKTNDRSVIDVRILPDACEPAFKPIELSHLELWLT